AFFVFLRAENYARSTLSRKQASLRAFFSWLRRTGRLSSDPTRVLFAPRQQRKLPRFLRSQEIDALLSVPDDSPAGQRDRALLELLYASGIRAGEAVNLEVRDIDLESGEIRIRKGKGGKQRIALFGAAAEVAVRRYLAVGRLALAAKAEG